MRNGQQRRRGSLYVRKPSAHQLHGNAAGLIFGNQNAPSLQTVHIAWYHSLFGGDCKPHGPRAVPATPSVPKAYGSRGGWSHYRTPVKTKTSGSWNMNLGGSSTASMGRGAHKSWSQKKSQPPQTQEVKPTANSPLHKSGNNKKTKAQFFSKFPF